jgi:hypothetical protein
MKKPERNTPSAFTAGSSSRVGNSSRTNDLSSGLATRARLSLKAATRKLLADQTESGYWEGKLGSSPFATALSVFALALGDR